MPKILVLFSSIDAYAARIADVVAEGAASVRFSEIDVRAVADADAEVSGRRRLASLDAISEYDGIIVVGPGPESPGHELRALLARFERGDALSDTVFALAGEDNPAMLASVARAGGLIVGQPRAADGEERARRLGARVAKVVGWVRHALAHEAEHARGHDHRHHHSH